MILGDKPAYTYDERLVNPCMSGYVRIIVLNLRIVSVAEKVRHKSVKLYKYYYYIPVPFFCSRYDNIQPKCINYRSSIRT